MTTLAHDKTMSMDEFLRMPENEHHEWIHGKAIAMAETPLIHSAIIMQVGMLLNQYVLQHRVGVVCAESAHYLVTLDDGSQTIRQADVSFIETDDPRQTLLQSPHPGSPDLAVEVVSKSDASAKVDAKTRMWLDNGARLVWVVRDDRQVTVHRPNQSPVTRTSGEQVEGQNILPGFACEVDRLYP